MSASDVLIIKTEEDMIIVGIDPGRNGGIAILNTITGKVTAWYRISKLDEQQLIAVFADLAILSKLKQGLKCVFEKPFIKAHMVYKMCPKCRTPILTRVPQQGIVTSLTEYGKLLGLAIANNLFVAEIESTAWKKHLELTKDKDLSFKLVAKLYPDVGLTLKCQDGVAEAILIAHYAKEVLCKSSSSQ